MESSDIYLHPDIYRHQASHRISKITHFILADITWTSIIPNSVSKLPILTQYTPNLPPPPEVGRYRSFAYDNHFLIYHLT